MRRGQRNGMTTFTAGLIALVLICVLTYLGFTKAIPFRQHFEVHGVFKTSNNLRLGSPVRIAGVTVGKVTAVEHSKKGAESAVVTMRIAKKGRPIRKDAQLAIRPRIFLEGNFFVDVQPGTPSATELEDGDVIPINQTRTPVQLDQILTALQSDTRDDLRVLLREYATALNDGGAEGLNRSTPYWEPAYRDGALVADALQGTEEHDLSRYEKSAAQTAEALDRHPEQLKALVSDLNTFAAAFAREDDSLKAAVAELPRTLRAARPALGALNEAFPPLRALARDLRPGVRNSEAAIDASIPLVQQLRGLVSEDELRGLTADLRTTVPSLAALTEGSVPFFREVRRLSSCQNEVILPWSLSKVSGDPFEPKGPVYQEAPKPFTGLGGESRSGDSNGQWFRVLAAGSTNLVQLRPGMFATSMLPIQGANPPKPSTRPPLRPDVPCETQQTPDLRSKPGAPPPQQKIDTTDPEYVKGMAKARAQVIDWARGQLKYEGLSDEITISDEPATLSDIQKVAAQKKAENAARRARILGARP